MSATKERLHQLVDELSETEAENTLRLLDSRRAADSGSLKKPEMAPLPPGWGQTLNGEPMPDVAAAVHRSREAH